MRALVSFALAASVLAPPSPASAQETGSVRESAEATLVEVPVRVIGRDGQPVRNLTAADFTVEDDGRRQAIVGFDAIDLAEKGTTGDAAAANPAARRRFLILFDCSFSQPKSIVGARRAAREFVLQGMGDRDLAAVATYSVEKGVRVLVTFTADRAQLARAVETLGPEAGRDTGDPLAFAFDQAAGAPAPGVPPQRQSGGRSNVAGLVESLQALSIMHRMRDDEYARGRVRHLFQSFRELSQALDTVEGRKDVIYLSEGFRGRYVVGAPDTDQERQWLIHGEVWKVDSDKRYGSTPLRGELDQLGQVFRRSDLVIHAVDIAGIRAETDPDTDGTIGARESENGLFEIAHGSGGEVFRNANDFGAELAEIVRQTSLVYVLAFRPERPAEEGRYHELRVKANVPGARVLARAGYYDRRGFRKLSPLEPRLLAAGVIANEIAFDDIPARVLAVPFAAASGTASVPVLLEIPGPGLVASDANDKLQLEIYAYAFGADGHLQDYFVRTLGADLSRNREKLMAGGVRYYGGLRLPPGSYRLRTLVRNSSTGRMGFSVRALEVPKFAGGEPYLLPPVFLDRPDAWISISGSVRADGLGAGNPFAALPSDGLTPAALG